MSQLPNPAVLALVHEIVDYKETHPEWGVLGAVASWIGIDNHWEQVATIFLPGETPLEYVPLQISGNAQEGYYLSDHTVGVGYSKDLSGIPDLH